MDAEAQAVVPHQLLQAGECVFSKEGDAFRLVRPEFASSGSKSSCGRRLLPVKRNESPTTVRSRPVAQMRFRMAGHFISGLPRSCRIGELSESGELVPHSLYNLSNDKFAL